MPKCGNMSSNFSFVSVSKYSKYLCKLGDKLALVISLPNYENRKKYFLNVFLFKMGDKLAPVPSLPKYGNMSSNFSTTRILLQHKYFNNPNASYSYQYD